jgi:formylmethanofuran dehydrogenase subunit E
MTKRVKMTKEQQKERERERRRMKWLNMTEEQKEEHRRKRREYDHQHPEMRTIRKRRIYDIDASLLEKRCSKCGEVFPVSYFSKNKMARSGLNYWCRFCVREAYIKRHKQHGSTRELGGERGTEELSHSHRPMSELV